MTLLPIKISATLCLLLSVITVVLAGNDRAQWKCSKENNLKCQRDRGHCQRSIENCEGCIRHISRHMGSGRERHCNEQRLRACRLTKNYVTALKAQSEAKGDLQSRAAMDLPGTYEGADCIDWNERCVNSNDPAICSRCVHICQTVVTALDHILLVSEELDFFTILRDTCRAYQQQLPPVIEHIQDDGFDVNLVLVPNFPRHSFHCGLPTKGF
ncbi:hypothetical protein BWQ96_04916 [Gracilariopsis chorda]|uniref:Saposin B-type domain-containing protein n=1 Tax=Gracilariopsis chorda TaxID=448386 RepID=A0A2V3IT80_9FLOR|nr:hypothetical protein BWQ96_04916 [Gracilariopsis chorda]|eukprot:PXF45326.1 hypothetical protein BWQ96_04916 [Gracilariopsis chorda]